MTNPDETQPTLPGLELGDPKTHGHMRAAVAATFDALNVEGLLKPRHVGLVQLALELADSVDRAGGPGSKPYGVALVAGQLRDTLLALPAPAEAGDGLFEKALAAYLEAGAQT